MNQEPAFLRVKDHSVSGEYFELIKNSEYGFLETTPKPSLDTLQDYYKSEDYISHTDSKRNLFEKAYHLVRTISLSNKLKLINSFHCESKTVLDIGCGTGDFLLKAKQNDWIVTGVEPNSQARSIANKKLNNLVYGLEALEDLKAHSFDIITLWHVLEHIPDLENQIQIFKSILKPEGVLIVAVPNHKSYDANHYKEFWAAYDVPRHFWHFDRSSISNLFFKYKMKVVKTMPMLFDAFYVSMLSEKYKSGKMNFIKAICVALISNSKYFRTKEASSLIYIIKNN